MFEYFPTITNFLIALFCLIFIYILSIKQESDLNNKIIQNKKNNLQIILYYDSSNNINLTFLDTIWKQLLFKYNKSTTLYFSQIDVFKNKYYKNYTFESTPTIYITINDYNLIYKYNKSLNLNDIEHFIMQVGADFNSLN